MLVKKLFRFKTLQETTLCLIVAIISILPHIWAYLRVPEGYFFIGVNTSVNLSDVEGVYFAAMHNFSIGDILYRNPFDPLLKPFFHYPLYLVLGKIVALTSLPVSLVYNLAAFGLTFIFLIFIFKFIKLFFNDRPRQLLTFALASFGGLFLFGSSEGIGLFSFTFPHFIVAQLALFICLYILIQICAKQVKQKRQLLAFCLSLIVLGLTHPWMAIPLGATYLTLGAFLIVKRRISKLFIISFLILIIFSLPFLLYFGNPARIPWVSYHLGIPFYSLILLYGLMLPVAILGLLSSLKKSSSLPLLILAFWLIIQTVFVYLPLPFQRRFVEGLYLPLAIFAVVGVDWLNARLHLPANRILVYCNAFIYCSIGVISNYLILFVWLPNQLIYRPIEQKAAVSYLDKNSKRSEIVLSLPDTGYLIASFAGLKIFVGHEIQTPDYNNKFEFAENYYTGKISAEKRKGMLFAKNICFVYVGRNEGKIANIDFLNEPYLNPFFKNNLVSIYKTTWCK